MSYAGAGSCPSAEMQSVYSTAPSIADWAEIVQCLIEDTHWGGSYPSAEMQSVYSTASTTQPIGLDLCLLSQVIHSEKQILLMKRNVYLLGKNELNRKRF